jgi:nicotinamide-nucleotide amidase
MTTGISELLTTVSQQLKHHNYKIVTAESCTGGGLAYALTELPGSSDWFERGFVTYSNTAKADLLGVTSLTLVTYGSVSEHTAREMAEGALHRSQANISVAITGIAGPTGGSPDKPVGTVWLSYAGVDRETVTSLLSLEGNRSEIREKTILHALEKLLLFI